MERAREETRGAGRRQGAGARPELAMASKEGRRRCGRKGARERGAGGALLELAA